MSNKAISLVLGSGGARGLAHVGVIRWLEEHGHQIRSISVSANTQGCNIGIVSEVKKQYRDTSSVYFCLCVFRKNHVGDFIPDRQPDFPDKKFEKVTGDPFFIDESVLVKKTHFFLSKQECRNKEQKQIWSNYDFGT